MPLTDITKGLKRNWKRPYFWRQQILQRFAAPIQQSFDKKDRVDILSQEWDNLLILDGCRADLFDEVINEYQIDGELSTVYSKGSGSVEFLRENFSGRDCSDIVYVTSNPFVKTELDSPFFTVDHVWVDGWDSENDTVNAKTMVDRAKQAMEKYPKKRLIVHFMQPHYPFIGEKTVDSDGFDLLRSKAIGEDNTKANEDVWSRLSKNELTKDAVWQAYRSNLRYVLNEVEDFIQHLDGRTVITSDHGNALGESAKPLPVSVYGHPTGLRMDSLTRVPWLEIEQERREIVNGDRKDKKDTNDDVIEDRLEALGYR